MRALLVAIEAGQPVVPCAEMTAGLTPAEIEAFERAGILRLEDADEGEAPLYELSWSDLVRTVRALYGVRARGLGVPPTTRSPVTLGSIGKGPELRDVVLVPWSQFLGDLTARRRRTLAIVPTRTALTAERRAKHGPGAYIEIEALEDALVVQEGRLVRATRGAPDAPLVTPAATRVKAASPKEPRGPAAPVTPIPGVTRWNEVRIVVIDETTVRIHVGKQHHVRSHVDLGMVDARSDRPSRVWQLLLDVCESQGIFSSRRFGGVDATKKLLSRLRQKLQPAFGLKDSPFHPYRRGQGWQARFVAEPYERRD